MIYTYGQTIRNVEEYGAVYAGYYIVDVDCFAGCVPDDPVSEKSDSLFPLHILYGCVFGL